MRGWDYRRPLSGFAQVREAGRILPAAGAPGRSVVLPSLELPNWAPFAHAPILQGWNALRLRALERLLPTEGFFGSFIDDPTLVKASSHVLDLLRTTLVVCRNPGAEFCPVKAESNDGDRRWGNIEVAREKRYELFVNRRALPVAWLVHQARVVPVERAVDLIRGTAADADFDPTREALVEAPILDIEPLRPDDDEPPVTVRAYGEDEIGLVVEPRTSALLVTSELSYPGWTAAIDGRDTAVLTANTAFRAVIVPPGRHDVVLKYGPRSSRIGLAISGGGLIALLACALGAWHPENPGRRDTAS